MVQYFTKEGLEKLKEELKDIRENQMQETKNLIAEARAFGDLKEKKGKSHLLFLHDDLKQVYKYEFQLNGSSLR